MGETAATGDVTGHTVRLRGARLDADPCGARDVAHAQEAIFHAPPFVTLRVLVKLPLPLPGECDQAWERTRARLSTGVSACAEGSRQCGGGPWSVY